MLILAQSNKAPLLKVCRGIVEKNAFEFDTLESTPCETGFSILKQRWKIKPTFQVFGSNVREFISNIS